MPWKEVKPMDEKVLFIADYLRQQANFSQLCEHYGVSRKTGYKWVARYRQQGTDGLEERSRRPNVSSTVTPYTIQKAILELRVQQRDAPGAKKIQALLMRQFEASMVPSKTTIYNILHRAGQIEPQRRAKRVSRNQPHPLKNATSPNELWSVDYKGQFKTRNGRWCYPLTIMDHASRYLLACHGLPGTRFTETQAIFERLFREYGLPERIRTDNGVPFASLGVGGLSRLSVWWIRLGIIPERIAPGQPQQNGRHERMHRTLKRTIGQLPATSLKTQQLELDAFRIHYNEQRPHEGLQQRTPSACYQSSPRAYPQHLPELEYPSYFHRSRVARNGLIYWRAFDIYIGYLLAGEWIGLDAVGDGVWDVYFGPLRIGRFDEHEAKGRYNYLTLKV